MRKILLSITTIVFSIGGLVLAASLLGNTNAIGETFAPNVMELKIDNESYVTNNEGVLVYSPETSWKFSTLPGKFFFKFPDVKPGDIGEDTISLHVSQNNAWACMKVDVTKIAENGRTEPEKLVDNTGSEASGELHKFINFVFWADDGDNVYEKGEKVFKRGPIKDIFNGKYWTIADSKLNIWTGNKGEPMKAGVVKYIGKAWCFGSIKELPIQQDGKGKTGKNGPLVRGTGFSCDGSGVSNMTQTDTVKADVTFSVLQANSNSKFLCSDNDPKKR